MKAKSKRPPHTGYTSRLGKTGLKGRDRKGKNSHGAAHDHRESFERLLDDAALKK